MSSRVDWEKLNREEKAKKESLQSTISGVSVPDDIKKKIKNTKINSGSKRIAEGSSVKCKKCKNWMRQVELISHSCTKCIKCHKFIDSDKIKYHKCRKKDLNRAQKNNLNSKNKK
ncbi:MAG: hypothetical protein HOI31_05770 [Gammaproteobacteria bacterium]|jgi:acetyl-CoA carboxylase beta subunit|nr:hypothetical protein [Gammaproteobacteria bacterium]MBT5745783.1 hypothetical protein [Gammaproteobacteria bacterium]